ncbi:chaplin [Streptomyces sp. L7]
MRHCCCAPVRRARDPDPVGVAVDSPGVLSGNVVQIPIDLDLNVCGNSINVIGLLNPAAGNHCEG